MTAIVASVFNLVVDNDSNRSAHSLCRASSHAQLTTGLENSILFGQMLVGV